MAAAQPLIRRLCVIGVGLIGGSLTRALREKGEVAEVIGSGRNEDNLRAAVRLGVVDRYDTDPARAVAGTDVVVVAVPLGAIEPVLRAIVPALSPDAVVTDVGSAKGSVVADVERIYGHVPPNFVPGHPIAGTEKSGVEASFATLFQRRRVILTPLAETAAAAHHLIKRMWELTGAEVVDMGVRHHDAVLAATSHLPHMLAYAFFNSVQNQPAGREFLSLAGPGFRDFTRIAASDPTMWRDILSANREEVLKQTQRFRTALEAFELALKTGNADALEGLIRTAAEGRSQWHMGGPRPTSPR